MLIAYQVPENPNPAWANTEHTRLDLDVVFRHIGPGAVRLTVSNSTAEPDYVQSLFARAAGGEFGEVAPYVEQEVAPEPQWRDFLAALRATSVFATLRGQARVDVAVNALATELRTVLGEAALGMVEVAEVQELLDELLPTLTPEQVAEIEAGIAAFSIPLTMQAPAP